MVRVGYLARLWIQGGQTRGRVNAIIGMPPDAGVEVVATGVLGAMQFDAQAARRVAGRHTVYCHEPVRGGLAVRTANPQDSFQRVIDACDVVCLHGLNSPEDVALLHRLAWNDRAVVVSAHGSCGWTRQVIEACRPFAKHYYAVSHAALRAFPDDLRPLAEVIHNGVDFNRLTPTVPKADVRRRWGVKAGERVVLYLGRLAFDKNVTAAALAARELGEGWRAVYVGSGLHSVPLTTEIKQILPDAVFVASTDQVGDALNAADVLVMATESEGHCQAVTEAWAAGLPVVSTRVGAVPELEDRFGRLVTPVPVAPDGPQLAEAVLRAVSDGETVQRARRAAWEHLSVAVFARKFAAFCRKAAGKEKAARRVLWVADVPGWSFDRKSKDYAKHMPYEADFAFASKRVTGPTHFLSKTDPYDAVIFLHHGNVPRKKIAEYVAGLHDRGTGIGCCVNFVPTAQQLPDVVTRLRHFDAVAANNPHALAMLRESGFEPFYTPDGYDPEVFNVQTPFDERPFAVCFVSSVSRLEHKGYAVWKEARARLEGRGVEFVEVVADSFNNDRSWADMAAIYNRCKLYACLSISEGGPCPLFESAACGCVPISTRTGIAHTYKNVRLIDRTADAFCEQLVHLRDNPDVLRGLHEGVLAEAPQYRSDVIAPLWAEFIAASVLPGDHWPKPRKPHEEPYTDLRVSGSGGDVRLVTARGERVVRVSRGVTYTLPFREVLRTGTTATGLVALRSP